MRAIHEGRANQRKLEAAEKARLESQGRVDTIVQIAASALGDPFDIWMDAPDVRLDGLTPREAAARTSGLLAKATGLLHDHVTALAKKAKWVQELEREASKLFQRLDKLKLYMTSSDPDLPGRAAPAVYVKDEQTMQQCLTLLKRRFRKR
jgi:hypothetical protein